MTVTHESVPSFSSGGTGLLALPIALGGRRPNLLPGRSFVGVAERLPGVGLVTRGSAREMRDPAAGFGEGGPGVPVPVYLRWVSVREKMACERDD